MSEIDYDKLRQAIQLGIFDALDMERRRKLQERVPPDRFELARDLLVAIYARSSAMAPVDARVRHSFAAADAYIAQWYEEVKKETAR